MVGVVTTPDAVRVEFQDSSTAEGDVLIGADGLHSVVRDIVGAPDAEPTGWCSWQGLVTLPDLPDLANEHVAAIIIGERGTTGPRPASWATSASGVKIEGPVLESRFPVGSSARIIGGSIINARATATRCIWPPDSSAGLCSVRSPSPTRSRSRIASALALPSRTPSSSLGTATFSHADRVGTG